MSEVDLQAPEIQEAIKAAKDAAIEEANQSFESKLAEETEGLKSKNQQLLGEVKKFKAKASSVPDDFDPDAWKTMQEEAAKAREEAAKAEGKWDEYKAELVATHQQELESLANERSALKTQLEDVLVNNSIMTAIAHAKGNADLLMPHVRGHVKLVEEDGKQIARVIDAQGNPRIHGAKGDYMTIEQLLEEFKETSTFAPCFEGSRATGSGANGSNGAGGAANNPFHKDSLNLTEQARLKREDPDKAARLQAAARG